MNISDSSDKEMHVALGLKHEKRYSIALIREKQISNYTITETTIKFHVVTVRIRNRITSLETKKHKMNLSF